MTGYGALFSVSEGIRGGGTGWRVEAEICVGFSGIGTATWVGGASRIFGSFEGWNLGSVSVGWIVTGFEVFTSVMVLIEVSSSTLKIFFKNFK